MRPSRFHVQHAVRAIVIILGMLVLPARSPGAGAAPPQAALRQAVPIKTDITGPAGSDRFGISVTVLPNGNVVVTDRDYSGGIGAAYLYDGQTLAMISMLTGTTAGDHVGHQVIVLSNGHYLLMSPIWDNGAASNAGAVTWGSATTGVTGTVSSSNSLVGSTTDDQVGSAAYALTNGNYVITSSEWDHGALMNAGAATWGNGTTGITGTVSSANSLVGSTANDVVGGDGVGGGGVTILPSGHYVVTSAIWDHGSAADAGAVTWGNGTTGITGTISSANSLVGTTSSDQVGSSGVVALTNGNYVVSSSGWNAGTGAVTWGRGTTGITGTISSANSLVGLAGDGVGMSGVVGLINGNYVVRSSTWDSGGALPTAVGAVTWGNGTTGTTGTVSSANSLIGSVANDQVGSRGLTALSNGNYVVRSHLWDHGTVADAGATTWGNGTTGITGTVSSANSLVGTTTSDQVGSNGVVVLPNGNYVVRSNLWDHATLTNVGAATWGNGTTGITGTISSTNSLIGATAEDQVGSSGVIALTNGNYVVRSGFWDHGTVTDAGAATWGNGTTGTTGTVSSANSLVGSNPSDRISTGMTALTNGNYVVMSSFWDAGTVTDAGAVTWGSGTTGITGTVSSANSLVGSTPTDQIGSNVHALTNGNYVVRSSLWDNGPLVDAGAVTWGDGTRGITGTISSANSLLGSTAEDQVGSSGVTALPNGHYFVRSSRWDHGALQDSGAVTWGDGTLGTTGAISDTNSVLDTTAGGGQFLVADYDLTYHQLWVGRPLSTIVTVWGPLGEDGSRAFLPFIRR